MSDREHKELRTKAEGGDTRAQIELARQLDSEGQDSEAVEWIRKAIAGGEVNAKTLLAERFITRAPYNSEEGRRLLFSAVAEHDPEATHVAAVFYACGIHVQRDWNTSFEYLARAAELGFPRARDELTLLATGNTTRDREMEPAPEHWTKLCQEIDLASWLAVPPQNVVSRDPRIMIVENVVSESICDWLIERAKPNRAAATVFDQATGELHRSETRTNSAAGFNAFKMDMIFAMLRLRITALTGLSTGMESINILHYEPGQSYSPHFDFIAATHSDASLLTQGRQRVVTFLLYLNDDYEGGETRFPRIPWQHKGQKGDAMFFWNVDMQGQPDPKTLHEGSAPTKGEKWVLSQWIQRDLRTPSPNN